MTGLTVRYLRAIAYLRERLTQARDDERGFAMVEWAIGAAILAGVATLVFTGVGDWAETKLSEIVSN